MKTKRLLVILILTTLVALIEVACQRNTTEPARRDVDYYTCTMHPSVKSKDPKAKCPICSMDLTPVRKRQSSASTNPPSAAHSGHDHAKMFAEPAGGKGESAGAETNAEFTVPVARQQQIGVTYAVIETRPLHQTIRTLGIVALDKQRHWDYVSRVEGYVQKLEVSSRGEAVKKDQPLLTLYSPELFATQREFVELLRTRDQTQKSGSAVLLENVERLLESAKDRLRLLNFSTNQIAQLAESREAKETLTLHSPFHGIVQDLPVDQGRRVMAGDHLVDMADLSVVWVWAEFYQDELPLVKKDLPVTLTASPYPNERFAGKIALVDPFIIETKRTGRVRIDVENPDFKLRPDMYVDVELELNLGHGLVVPVPAVLPTGKRNIVFVDKGEGKLEPRFIELGRKYGAFYEVKSGLKETERVVTSANFLIDAEAKVQGALKSW